MPKRISVVDVVDETGTRVPPARAQTVATHLRVASADGGEGPLRSGQPAQLQGGRSMSSAAISADSHIVEPPGCYVDHIDAKWRDIAPRVEKNDKGVDAYVIDGLANP